MFAARAATRAIGSRSVLGNKLAVRNLHVENKPGESVPFSHNSKAGFAVKMTAFLGLGFALPIFNAWLELK